MRCQPTPAVVRAAEHYSHCDVCRYGSFLTASKVEHVLKHLPEECTPVELTDSQFLALFLAAYRCGFREGRYPFSRHFEVTELLGAIYERDLGNDLGRLLRHERAMLVRRMNRSRRRPR